MQSDPAAAFRHSAAAAAAADAAGPLGPGALAHLPSASDAFGGGGGDPFAGSLHSHHHLLAVSRWYWVAFVHRGVRSRSDDRDLSPAYPLLVASAAVITCWQ